MWFGEKSPEFAIMAIGQKCAACGCLIPDAQIKAGRAVLKGTRFYCAKCASLIIEPQEVTKKESKVKLPASKPLAVGAEARGSGRAGVVTQAADCEQAAPKPMTSGRSQAAASSRPPPAKGSDRLASSKNSNRAEAAAQDASPSARVARKGSARMQTVGSSRLISPPPSSRATLRAGSVRNQNESEPESRASGRNQRNTPATAKGLSPKLMAGIGVGVLFLALLAYMGSGSKAGSGGGNSNKKKESGKAFEDSLDGLSVDALVKKGEECLSKGDRKRAMDCYNKAGEVADQRSPGSGSAYSTKAYQILKTTVLHEGER
jgi:hypothetical protein